eukprot:CAMPEP_0168574604 /NCGR_PEP_ID=MMETSP0413-20121227/19182_1 /TAXON_ID=136452 /ORGANISM="Filamoeba nolandi, Strain NC-AS-23-1" /LENGTH=71 /DNA_ID=CAMNT_0008607983 /DNA_START=49 /DNA_END=261 /DNA_ORIENTATION=-
MISSSLKYISMLTSTAKPQSLLAMKDLSSLENPTCITWSSLENSDAIVILGRAIPLIEGVEGGDCDSVLGL